MDIHRSRFVRFPASPINALAFSRSDDKGFSDPKPALKLALGRADGSIEIWSTTRGNWVQESVIPGSIAADGSVNSIDGLAWTQDPDEPDPSNPNRSLAGDLRLFSIGGGNATTGSVTEWDLAKGRPVRISTGNFSEVWCLAAQPRFIPGKKEKNERTDGPWTGQVLVAGCGDGTLAILTTQDNDLTFKRFLARGGSRKTKCVSVTWQNREKVVAGFSDGNIRIFDARNGSMLRNMSLGAGLPGAPKDVLVWKVKCLPNGDIVSADSNGEVRFWEGRNYSMTQRVDGHDADCLDLVTSSDGQTVFSGGIDGKIAVYKLTSRDGQKKRWAKTNHRRMHTGEVKAMAVYDTKQMSVVISGGSDTTSNLIPLREFGKENFRRLPGLPQTQPCASAPEARLLVSWWDRVVNVWHVASTDVVDTAFSGKNKHRILQLGIKGNDNIASVAISSAGDILAVSTFSATYLYQLRMSSSLDSMRARLITMPSEVAGEGSRLVALSPDGCWVSFVSLDNDIKILRIDEQDAKHIDVVPAVTELEVPTSSSNAQSGLRRYNESISRITFSSDSQRIAVSRLTGNIDVFSLKGAFDHNASAHERVQPSTNHPSLDGAAAPKDSDDSDSDIDEDDLPISYHGQTWQHDPISSRLPRLDSPALLLTFHPTGATSHLLLVITQHHQLYELDLALGKLSSWSRRNPTATLPLEFRGLKERVMGCTWDVLGALPESASRPDSAETPRTARLWLHATSWLGMLDIRQEFSANPSSTSLVPESDAGGLAKKRKRESHDEHFLARAESSKRARHHGLSGAGDRVRASEAGGTDLSTPSLQRRAGISTADDAEDDEDTLALREEEFNLDAELDLDMDRDEREIADGNAEDTVDTDGDTDGADRVKGQKRGARKWWCTYKYRPVLGLVGLSTAARRGTDTGPSIAGADDSASAEGPALTPASGDAKGMVMEVVKDKDTPRRRRPAPLEVVLIERPVWELEHVRA